LKGGTREGHKELCWATGGCRAVRAGQWKVVSPKGGKPWELYDLANDRAETHDLASKSPGRTRDLAARWEQWAERTGDKPCTIARRYAALFNSPAGLLKSVRPLRASAVKCELSVH